MNAITHIVKTISRSCKMKYLQRKPEILVYGGITGLIVSGVLACFETKKAEEELQQANDQIIILTEELGDTKEAHKAKAKLRIKTIGKLILIYLPAVVLAFLSARSICGGFGTLKARELDATAALAVMTSKYQQYREGARAIIGDDADEKILHGLVTEREEETVKDPETGKEKRRKVSKVRSNANLTPGRSFYLNRSNWKDYTGNFAYDIKQLELFEKSLNDILHLKQIGDHPSMLLLTEALQMLGYEYMDPYEEKTELANDGWISYASNPTTITLGLEWAKTSREKEYQICQDDILVTFNCVSNVFGMVEVAENE